MDQETNKKIYLKCSGCEKGYFSGMELDEQSNLLMNENFDKPKSCPLCGQVNSEDTEINYRPPTECSEETGDMSKTYKFSEYKLKIECPDCYQLREISGRCWYCDSQLYKEG